MNKKFIPILFLATIILTITLTSLTTPIQAHTDGTIEKYHYTLKTNPEHPKQNENTQIILTIHDSTQTPTTKITPTIELLREKLTLTETTPGTYTTNYIFPVIGPIDTKINIQQQTEQTKIFVTPQNHHTQEMKTSTFTITLIITFFAILQITTLLKINGKIELGTAILILAIVATLLFLIFGFNYYKNSEYNQGCFFNLPDGTKTYHCHQYVYVQICGQNIPFEREEGDLGRGHTHDDGHKIHWHPYQPTSTPEKDMTLRNLFKDLGLEITKTTIQNPQTKQIHNSCNNEQGTTEVYEILEGQKKETQINNFLDYPLEDEATYNIKYS